MLDDIRAREGEMCYLCGQMVDIAWVRYSQQYCHVPFAASVLTAESIGESIVFPSVLKKSDWTELPREPSAHQRLLVRYLAGPPSVDLDPFHHRLEEHLNVGITCYG